MEELRKLPKITQFKRGKTQDWNLGFSDSKDHCFPFMIMIQSTLSSCTSNKQIFIVCILQVIFCDVCYVYTGRQNRPGGPCSNEFALLWKDMVVFKGREVSSVINGVKEKFKVHGVQLKGESVYCWIGKVASHWFHPHEG